MSLIFNDLYNDIYEKNFRNMANFVPNMNKIIF